MDERNRPDRPHVRICLGAEQDRQRLERALAIIAEVAADTGQEAQPTYV